MRSRTALVEDERDRVETVGEVVCDHGDEDEDARRGVDVEGQSDAEPVDEGVDRERARSERAHVRVGARLFRRIAMVEHEQPLGEEEGQEPDPDQHTDALRVVEDLDRLRQHVEQCDGHHDAAVSAIAVVRSRLSRIAAAPPASVAANVATANGSDPGHGSRFCTAQPDLVAPPPTSP